jgi:predicted lipoprotein with Yx(FWY)xxD motif
MKKLLPVFIVLVLVLGVIGYKERHAIKSMLMGTSAPTTQVATAASDNIYLVKTDVTKGAYLADFQGMTLYTYDKDTTGVSNCYNGCVKAWPAYTSGATAQSQFPANISVVTRTDGTKQFAWKGMPLYYYAADAKVGDITGDGFGGVWHIVTP